MTKYVGVFRTQEGLQKMQKKIIELQQRYQEVTIDDRSEIFNLDLIEAFEIGNLLSFSQVIIEGALARTESRGAHYRTDYPKRDDKQWLRHTFAWKNERGIKLDYSKEVVIDMNRFPPQERKY